MDTATRVQILDEAVDIFHCVIILGKGMRPITDIETFTDTFTYTPSGYTVV